VGGTGKNPLADATRAPALASGLHWDCPFPVEADDAGIDSAVVGLRVEVAADGKVREAKALADPGHGFAREARRCALSKRWAPGLNRAGQPVVAVALVNVRFER
jgi:protein TonB